MAFGFGVLRLSTESFWAMTPRELAAAIDGVRGGKAKGEAPSRSALESLMAAFPDEDMQ